MGNKVHGRRPWWDNCNYKKLKKVVKYQSFFDEAIKKSSDFLKKHWRKTDFKIDPSAFNPIQKKYKEIIKDFDSSQKLIQAGFSQGTIAELENLRLKAEQTLETFTKKERIKKYRWIGKLEKRTTSKFKQTYDASDSKIGMTVKGEKGSSYEQLVKWNEALLSIKGKVSELDEKFY